MKIYKFGSASVKDAASIINVANILKTYGFQSSLVVISAMGKMTNALESVIASYIDDDGKSIAKISFVKKYHFDILQKLFDPRHIVFDKVENLFVSMQDFFSNNSYEDYDFIYDQVVVYGELLSTTILSEYLRDNEIPNNWIDVRQLIKTDNTYRNANVDWILTNKRINEIVSKKALSITQGFIGEGDKGITTTLGREVPIIQQQYLPIVSQLKTSRYGRMYPVY